MVTVSVAMATYNGGTYVRQQLESIASQTLLPNELLIGDDGSTDQTLEIVEQFRRESNLAISLIRNPKNLGSTLNFESLLHRAKGDIVFLADQDDVWRNDKVERLTELLFRHPKAAFAFSDARLVSADGEPRRMNLWSSIHFAPKSTLLPPPDLFRILVQRNVVTGATMAIRREAIELVPSFPSEWVHDAWISSILSYSHSAIACFDPLIDYRIHSQQQLGLGGTHFSYWDLLRGRYADSVSKELRRIVDASNLISNATTINRPGDQVACEKSMNVLKQIRDHCLRRIGVRCNSDARFLDLISELATGRYQSFSFGIGSAFRDLFRL